MLEDRRLAYTTAILSGDGALAESIILDLEAHDDVNDRCLAQGLRSSMARRRGDHVAASQFAQQALDLATDHGLATRKADALVRVAEIARDTHHGESVFPALDQAEAIFLAEDDTIGLHTALLEQARYYYELGDLESAHACALKVWGSARRHGIEVDEARAAAMLGGTAMLVESDARAIEYLRRGLEIATRLGLTFVCGQIEMNLGSANGRLGDNVTSIKHYLKSIEICQRLGIVESVAMGHMNIGACHFDMGDFASAIKHHERALEILESVSAPRLKAHTLMALGAAQLEHGEQEVGLRALIQAQRLAIELGDHGISVSARANIVEYYMQSQQYEEARAIVEQLHTETIIDSQTGVDLSIQRARLAHIDGNATEAESILQQALSFASERGLMRSQVNVLNQIAAIRRSGGDLEGYITAHEEASRLDQQLRGAERTRQVAALEQQQAMEQQQLELERHRLALYATLPKHVAERVLKGEQVTDNVSNACVLFLDIAGFTALSSSVPAGHVVHLLEAIFGACDEVIHKHGLTKVKTIGDSYMAVAGVVEDTPDPVGRMAHAALDLMDAMNTLQVTMPPELGDTSWVESIPELKVRIGIDYGPVVAGIVGKDRLQYDVWGDTVNTASRMESTGEPGRIQVSESFARALNRVPGASSAIAQAPGKRHMALTERGEVNVKGKGTMTTYWLEPLSNLV